jgi:hypothetical protein
VYNFSKDFIQERQSDEDAIPLIAPEMDGQEGIEPVVKVRGSLTELKDIVVVGGVSHSLAIDSKAMTGNTGCMQLLLKSIVQVTSGISPLFSVNEQFRRNKGTLGIAVISSISKVNVLSVNLKLV